MQDDVLPEFILIARPSTPHHRTGATRDSLCDAWRVAIESMPPSVASRFTIREEEFDAATLAQEVGSIDCLVSPANTFGIMDGGYDLALSLAFSKDRNDIWTLTNIVQDMLKRRFRGYLPPTSCTLVSLPPDVTDTNDLKCKVIAVVPTMRVPEDVSWHVDLPYESMWNILSSIRQWNQGERPEGSEPIRRVLMTGLGTGIGGISYEKCARQMFLAALNFSLGWGEQPRWDELLGRAKELDETRTL